DQPNEQNQRLQQIRNLGPAGALLSQFDYAYNSAGEILAWGQSLTGLASPQRYDFTYDDAGQLGSALLDDASTGAAIQTYGYKYDAAGNRTLEQAGNTATTSGH